MKIEKLEKLEMSKLSKNVHESIQSCRNFRINSIITTRKYFDETIKLNFLAKCTFYHSDFSPVI